MSTFRNSSVADFISTGSISAPAGLQSGDILVMGIHTINNNTTGEFGTINWPSGFSQIGHVNSGVGFYGALWVAAKKAGGSEPASYSVSWNFSDPYYMVLGLCAWSGLDQTTWVDGVTTQYNSTQSLTTYTPPITPTVSDTRLVSVYAHGVGDSGSATCPYGTPAGQTMRANVHSIWGGWNQIMLADEVISGTQQIGARNASVAAASARSLAISVLLREPQYAARTGTGALSASSVVFAGSGAVVSPSLKPFITPITSIYADSAVVAGTGTVA